MAPDGQHELDRLRARIRELEAADDRRREAERALRESEALYRTIFETTGTATVIIEEDGTIALANAGFSELTGHDAVAVEGRMTWPEFVVDADRERIWGYHRARRAAPGSVPHEYECRCQHRDGSPRELHVTVAMIPGTRRSVASFLDITQRRRAEAESREHLRELAVAARAGMLGALASSLAHELNQPLCGILGCADYSLRLARSGEGNTAAAVEALEEVVEQAERAAASIRRIQTFLHHRRAEREPVDVGKLVQNAVDLLETEARHRGVRLRTVIAASARQVLADGVQIQQVIMNIMRNGIESMESPADEPEDLEIAVISENSHAVVVRVTDRGSGLPAGNRHRIFDPFFSTKADGLGLGLSLGRSIVEAHGGKIQAEDNPAGGAIVTLALPLWGQST